MNFQTKKTIAENKAIELAKMGCNSGFSTLYKAHSKDVYNYLLRLTKDPHISENIVADTFITVITKIDTYNPEKCGIKTWFITIARNRYIDMYRKEAENKQATVNIDTEGVFLVDNSTEKATESADIYVILREMVSELDHNQQEMVRLRYWKQYTHPEIADILGLPEGTVKGTLHRIKLRLRKRLESYL